MSIDARGRPRSRLTLVALAMLAASGAAGQERAPDGTSPPWQDPPARTERSEPDKPEGDAPREAEPARRNLGAAVSPAEPKGRRVGRLRERRERQAQARAAQERRRARAEETRRAGATRRDEAFTRQAEHPRRSRLARGQRYRGAIASDYAHGPYVSADPPYRDPLAQMRREGWGTLLAGSPAERAAQAQRRGYIVLRAREFHGSFGAVYRDVHPYDPGDDPVD